MSDEEVNRLRKEVARLKGLKTVMDGGDVGILVSFPEDDRETMAREARMADEYSVDLSLYSDTEIGGDVPGHMYEAQGDKQALANWLFYHLEYDLDEIKRIYPGLFEGVHPAHTDEDWYLYA